MSLVGTKRHVLSISPCLLQLTRLVRLDLQHMCCRCRCAVDLFQAPYHAQLTSLVRLELQYNGLERGPPAVVGELTSLEVKSKAL